MNDREPQLKILHVCPRPSFSGLEAYVLEMAQTQFKAGAQITLLVLAGSPLALKCREAGLATLEIEVKSSWWRRCQTISKLLSSADRPNLLHLHSTQDLDLVGLPIFLDRLQNRTAKSRPRVILQTHIWISHSKRDPLHAISYSLVDEVWCSSSMAAETLKKFLPIAANKIHVIFYGRDTEGLSREFLDRAEARKILDLPQNATVVATVARVDRGKGSLELFDGSIDLLPKFPDLHLVMIGPATADDPKAVALAQKIKERHERLPEPIKARIHLFEAIPRSSRLLKAFDLYALATYCECFSLALLEAQLAELPTLATNAGGSPEVVKENVTGWLFAPRSTSALKDALERALMSRESWRAYGLAARDRVVAEFDSTRILPTTLALYRAGLGWQK